MKARATAFFFGLAIGYRAGNFAAYWYLRARSRRKQAEGLRAIAALARVASSG